MNRRLIVNADDLGYTPGVTSGILRAHQHGIVTSTTVMVNMAGAATSIDRATKETPNLGLGLHLTLTAGRPILAPEVLPNLVGPEGAFHTLREFSSKLPDIDPAQIEQECRAQINRFIHLAGRLPDHLDSHHHALYLSSSSVEVLIKLAAEHDLPIRRPRPMESETAVSKSGVRTTENAINSFYGETATLGDLLNVLVGLPEGTSELMCHPAEVDGQLRRSSSYVDEREDELAILTHPSVKELIEAERIELITFGELV